MEALIRFIDILVYALTLAVLGRVIMSWVSPRGEDPLTAILYQMTEPILGPIRRILPNFGMFDFSPLILILLMNYLYPTVIRKLLIQILLNTT